MLEPVALGVTILLVGASPPDPQFWDTTIAGVTLEDPRTGRAFVMNHPTTADEPADDFPQFRCLNADGTEVLSFIMQYGDQRYQFAQFRVRRASRREAAQGERSAVQSFATGKGIRLGLTIDRVLELLGPGARKEGKQQVRLTYSCDSVKTCPGLGRVNVPQYQAIYTFRGNELVAFESGYPYP